MVLHPSFALTGVLHAIGGPLLPSLSVAFHLTDSQAGLLFFCYFAGTSLGALLCNQNYARSMAVGFIGLTVACLGIVFTSRTFVLPAFLILGVCVGLPMSAASMFAGRNFAASSAPALTFLNFSWSAGALAAPLLAARVLVDHTYRAAYGILAIAMLLASAACWFLLADAPEQPSNADRPIGIRNVRFIATFAFLTFLEVGVENTTISWLATYALRSGGTGASAAAASSSLYWTGFLIARGAWSWALLHINPTRVLRYTIVIAMLAAVLLISLPGGVTHGAAMFLLGAALAPIFPLLLARFFAGARHTSDSRWVLAICGFGGSVLPWLTGSISSHSGSLRIGLMTVPAALLVMICILPALNRRQLRRDN